MQQAPEAPPSWRARIFAVTWVSYFSYYLARMPFKATKTTLEARFGLTKGQLNWIDASYNIAYCLGQATNGYLVERIGPRRWVAIGMLLSATACVVFQQLDTFTGELFGGYVLVWGCNGFAQSTGWPGNGKTMAEWFGTVRRAEVLGWWSTCYQVGGIAATLLAARMIGWFDWRTVYIAPAIWVAVVAVAVALLVRNRPSDVGFCDPDSPDMSAEERRARFRAEIPRVLRQPMVWVVGFAYFCCKSIRYSFVFWLPYYLEKAFAYSKEHSLDVSIAFDAGGVVLVIAAGILADRVFKRRRVLTAFCFLWCLVGALFLYREVAHVSAFANIVTLGLVGGCLFAADSILSGTVSQDLGGPYAAGLAHGLVNSIGSIGQVLQGFLLVYVTDRWGWNTLFLVFMGLAAAGALSLIPYLKVGPRPSSAPALG
jgi:OPA family sugar phosphate sensor protein UhpC-like MFS transporter